MVTSAQAITVEIGKVELFTAHLQPIGVQATQITNAEWDNLNDKLKVFLSSTVIT